jgi:hypothetical protein
VEEIAAGAMCKVKGFEKFLSQIVAVGTHEEMNKKLDDMVGKERDKENELPPRKRKQQNLEDGPSTKKSRTGNKPPPKNQIKTPSRQKKAPKKTPKKTAPKKIGNILLVTSGPSTEKTASESGSPKYPSPPPPSPKPTSLPPALEHHSSLPSSSKPTDPPPSSSEHTSSLSLSPSPPPLPPKPIGFPKPDMPPPAASQPFISPFSSTHDRFEIPQADLQWYKHSPVVGSKKLPESSAVTPMTSSLPAIVNLSSSSDDSQGM